MKTLVPKENDLVESKRFPGQDGKLGVVLKVGHGYKILEKYELKNESDDCLVKGRVLWYNAPNPEEEKLMKDKQTLGQLHYILKDGGENVWFLVSCIICNSSDPKGLVKGRWEVVPTDKLLVLGLKSVDCALYNKTRFGWEVHTSGTYGYIWRKRYECGGVIHEVDDKQRAFASSEFLSTASSTNPSGSESGGRKGKKAGATSGTRESRPLRNKVYETAKQSHSKSPPPSGALEATGGRKRKAASLGPGPRERRRFKMTSDSGMTNEVEYASVREMFEQLQDSVTELMAGSMAEMAETIGKLTGQIAEMTGKIAQMERKIECGRQVTDCVDTLATQTETSKRWSPHSADQVGQEQMLHFAAEGHQNEHLPEPPVESRLQRFNRPMEPQIGPIEVVESRLTDPKTTLRQPAVTVQSFLQTVLAPEKSVQSSPARLPPSVEQFGVTSADSSSLRPIGWYLHIQTAGSQLNTFRISPQGGAIGLGIEAARLIAEHASTDQTYAWMVCPKKHIPPFIKVGDELCLKILSLGTDWQPSANRPGDELAKYDSLGIVSLSRHAADVLFSFIALGISEVEMSVPDGLMPYISLPREVCTQMMRTYNNCEVGLVDWFRPEYRMD